MKKYTINQFIIDVNSIKENGYCLWSNDKQHNLEGIAQLFSTLTEDKDIFGDYKMSKLSDKSTNKNPFIGFVERGKHKLDPHTKIELFYQPGTNCFKDLKKQTNQYKDFFQQLDTVYYDTYKQAQKFYLMYDFINKTSLYDNLFTNSYNKKHLPRHILQLIKYKPTTEGNIHLKTHIDSGSYICSLYESPLGLKTIPPKYGDNEDHAIFPHKNTNTDMVTFFGKDIGLSRNMPASYHNVIIPTQSRISILFGGETAKSFAHGLSKRKEMFM